jgi:hypothetical protein
MEPRLIPINALIALTTGEGGWPTTLADAGYRLHGIEALIFPANKRRVVVDAMVAHDATTSVVLAGCKGGQNLREPQMASYMEVTGSHVARQVGLPFRDPSVEVMVAGLEDHRQRIRIAMDALEIDVPLLLVGGTKVRLEGDLLGLSAFSVSVPGRPPRIIPIDAQSSDEDLVRYLLPGLMAAAARPGTKTVGVDTLLEKVIPWWALYQPAGGRQPLCKRATDALRAAITENFPDDFAVEDRKQQDCGIIRILRSPAEYRPRGVTQGWQRLQRQAERALGRRRPKPESPGQMAFSFEELGLDAEAPGEAE